MPADTIIDAKPALMALAALEAYESSLNFDAGPLAIIAGYLRLCALAVEGAGYERQDVVTAMLAVVGNMLSDCGAGDVNAIAEMVAADVRDNITLFQACPDGVIGTIN